MVPQVVDKEEEREEVEEGEWQEVAEVTKGVPVRTWNLKVMT